MNNIVGTVFTMSASVLALLFGLLYLFRPKFMQYHRMAIQKDWNELVPELQTLIIALMRALSSGFLSVGIAIAILQFEFNKSQQHWIALTILIIGSVLALGSVYAMFLVRLRTKGRPPITIVLIILVMLVIGYFFNISGL